MLANNEDPDQMPRSVASDLGLHCLPMSKKWDARRIWVTGETDSVILKPHLTLRVSFPCMIPDNMSEENWLKADSFAEKQTVAVTVTLI